MAAGHGPPAAPWGDRAWTTCSSLGGVQGVDHLQLPGVWGDRAWTTCSSLGGGQGVDVLQPRCSGGATGHCVGCGLWTQVHQGGHRSQAIVCRRGNRDAPLTSEGFGCLSAKWTQLLTLRRTFPPLTASISECLSGPKGHTWGHGRPSSPLPGRLEPAPLCLLEQAPLEGTRLAATGGASR